MIEDWRSLGEEMRTSVHVMVSMLSLCGTIAHAQRGTVGGEWPAYGGDAGSTKYAPLDQIDASNVERLRIVWQWESPDNAIVSTRAGLSVGGFKATPLMVDGVLYIRTSLSIVAALDAATGEELWTFDSGSWEMGRPTNLGFNSRGVAHWPEGPESRLFVATGDAYVWALDARTGRPFGDFGTDGKIDLTL